jgi:hypothetical protein
MLLIRTHRPPAWRHLCVSALPAQAAGAAEFADKPSAAAEATAVRADKSRYTLWNPTPREFMRELSADRPDKTESAYTVDAGHFQVEMDLVGYAHDHDQDNGNDLVRDAWAVAPMNLKLGILNNLDLQLMVETYNVVRTQDRVAGATERQSGYGDTTVRVKRNLWGNDGGETAMAVMPFVKFPTSQDDLGNNAVEGGLIFPFAWGLSGGWDFGATFAVGALRDEGSSGYHAGFAQSVTVGHEIIGNLAGYVEFFAEVSAERGVPWIGTVDLGLTYGVTSDLQLDAGVNLGVTDAADGVNPFVGLTWRH